MIEADTANAPNTASAPELEHQLSLLLTEVMDNPQSLGASVEDGSYSRTDTEYGSREEVERGDERSRSEVWLKISRALEHDPKFQLPGKFTEMIVASADIPGVAQVRLMTVNEKVTYVEYTDPYGKKGKEDGLEEAIEAIKLAVEELKSSKT